MDENAVLDRPPPHIESYLYKQDPRKRLGRQGWKHRYFVVIKDRVHYYESKAAYDKRQDVKGLISLSEVTDIYQETYASVPKKHHFNTGFVIATRSRNYNLVADSENAMGLWVSNLMYVKMYWSKQEIMRNTVVDDERIARLALEDEETEQDIIESSFTLYGDDEETSPTSSRKSTAFHNMCRIKVYLFAKKPQFVTMEKSSATPQKLIEKLINQLSSSACNVWEVDFQGNVRILEKEENLAVLKATGNRYYVIELSLRVLVLFFGDVKFESVIVPFTIKSDKVVALDQVKTQLALTGVSNPGLFLRDMSGQDQYLSPDDEPCSLFYHKVDSKLNVISDIGYLVVKNKSLGAEKRLKREALSPTLGKDAAAERKKQEEKALKLQQEKRLLEEALRMRKQIDSEDGEPLKSEWQTQKQSEHRKPLKVQKSQEDYAAKGSPKVSQKIQKEDKATGSPKTSQKIQKEEKIQDSPKVRQKVQRELSEVEESPEAKQSPKESRKSPCEFRRNGAEAPEPDKEEEEEEEEGEVIEQEDQHKEDSSEESPEEVTTSTGDPDENLPIVESYYGNDDDDEPDAVMLRSKAFSTRQRPAPGIFGDEKSSSNQSLFEKMKKDPVDVKAAALAARASINKRRYTVLEGGTSGSAAAAMAMGKMALRKEGEERGREREGTPARRGHLSKQDRMKRANSRVEIEREKPFDLPGPSFSAESRSYSFGASAFLSEGPSRMRSPSPRSWKNQMVEEQRIDAVFDSSKSAEPEAKDRLAELEKKANLKQPTVRKVVQTPRKLTDVDIDRLFYRQTTEGQLDQSDKEEKPVEVRSPAVLKIVKVHSSSDNDETPTNLGRKIDFISLSGILLRFKNGAWQLEPGSEFHSDSAVSDHCEVFTLNPDIRVVYRHDSKSWNVTKVGSILDQKENHQPVINVQQVTVEEPPILPRFLSLTQPRVDSFEVSISDKRRLVHQVQEAVYKIIQHFSATRDPEEKIMYGDDSITESVGHLVRGSFCSALAGVLTDGMKVYRLGGLLRNSLWDIIQSSVHKKGSDMACQVVNALKNHPAIVDGNMRYRTFVCGALNHNFLENWLAQFRSNQDVLKKRYEPHSLLRLASTQAIGPIYEELLLAVQPLNALPFRLFSTFELKQENRRQQQSVSSQTGSAETSAAEAVSVEMPRSSGSAVEALSQVQTKHESVQSEPVESNSTSTGNWFGRLATSTKESLQGYWGRMKTSLAKQEEHQQCRQVKAVFTNETDDPDELEFEQGDVLDVEEEINSDWLICRKENRCGLVPINYVERL